MVVATNGKPSRAGEEIFASAKLGGRTDLTGIERARDTIEKQWGVRISPEVAGNWGILCHLSSI